MDEIEDFRPQSRLAPNAEPVPSRSSRNDVQELPWRDVVVDMDANGADDRNVHYSQDAETPAAPIGFLRRQAAKMVWLVLVIGVVALLLDALEPWKSESCEAQGGMLVNPGHGGARCVDPAILK